MEIFWEVNTKATHYTTDYAQKFASESLSTLLLGQGQFYRLVSTLSTRDKTGLHKTYTIPLDISSRVKNQVWSLASRLIFTFSSPRSCV